MPPPISMFNKPKRKGKQSKVDGALSYVPSASDQFPFGDPRSQTTLPDKSVPASHSQAQPHQNMATAKHDEKRKTEDKYYIDASSTKGQKVTASSQQVTAFESAPNKRKVGKMTGIVDDLSVKASKALKPSQAPQVQTPKSNSTSSKKRLANTPVFPDSFSVKRPRKGSYNVEDDSVMDDAPLDTATAAAIDPKASDTTATATSSASVKPKYPISLEKLAQAEEAARAAQEKSASVSGADLQLPAKLSGKCFAV